VRITTNQRLQGVLRDLYDLTGVTGTSSTAVLEIFFERSMYLGDD